MSAKRVIIYPKDVQRMTGKSERACRAILAKIKKANQKATYQYVTIDEFASYTGLAVDTVQKYILD